MLIMPGPDKEAKGKITVELKMEDQTMHHFRLSSYTLAWERIIPYLYLLNLLFRRH